MRKIKVSGCLNCPYWMADNPENPETNHYCNHPSFGRALKLPIIPNRVFDDIVSGKEYTMCREEYMPNWCPLEYDGVVYVPQQIKC